MKMFKNDGLLTGQSWLQGPKAPSPKGDTHGAPLMQRKGQKQNFGIQYAFPSDETSGPVVETNVRLGNLSVSNFGVGIATKVGFKYPLDGFLGLGFFGQNTGEQKPHSIVGNAIIIGRCSLRFSVLTATGKRRDKY